MAPPGGWEHTSWPAKCLLLFVRVASVRLLKRHGPPVSPSPFQIVNGYFVHFFAPQGLPTVPKSVVFVIDISGSMHGRKMEQVLSSLRVGVRVGGGELFFCLFCFVLF